MVVCIIYPISLQIPVTRLAPFERFKENYHPLQMKGVYKRAVIAAIKVSPSHVLQHLVRLKVWLRS